MRNISRCSSQQFKEIARSRPKQETGTEPNPAGYFLDSWKLLSACFLFTKGLLSMEPHSHPFHEAPRSLLPLALFINEQLPLLKTSVCCALMHTSLQDYLREWSVSSYTVAPSALFEFMTQTMSRASYIHNSTDTKTQSH